MSLNGLLYLADMADSINCTLIILTILYTITCFFLSLNYGSGDDSVLDLIKKILKKWWIIAIFLLIIIITPSGKTLYIIAANNYINSSAIPQKVAFILNHELDEIVNHIKADKNA